MQTPQSSVSNYIITTKGAPETLKRMVRFITLLSIFITCWNRIIHLKLSHFCYEKFKEVPDNYDTVHEDMARKGARILALGYKEIGELSSLQLREMSRDEAESNLIFAGFVVISCPLKYDSKTVIKDLKHSTHHVRQKYNCLQSLILAAIQDIT